MLPAGARLRHRPEFAATVRGGKRRAGRSSLLVVHLLQPAEAGLPVHDGQLAPARAGFVVSRSVGGAVVRNRVRRRLRHLVARRLGDLPRGTALVVRALPGSAAASSAELSTDLDTAVRGAMKNGEPRRSAAVVPERVVRR